MERISGWYKRRVRWVILAIAFVVTISMNADTFHIANTLYKNADLRKSVVSYVDQSSQQAESSTDISELLNKVDAMQLPIGWTKASITPQMDEKWTDGQSGSKPTFWAYVKLWLLKVIGLLFTTFAASQGAPFWFDVLNKLNSLRGSGGRPQKAEESTQKV